MSDVSPLVSPCPQCGVEHTSMVFSSVNGALLPGEVEAIIEGTFEQTECRVCAHRWQPEHEVLYVDLRARHWVVMYPSSARRGFAQLERAVQRLMETEFAHAPAVVAPALAGVRPRLVFGHHMLAEALRTLKAGQDPALVEAAKLLWVRRNLSTFLALGPIELCVEVFEPDRSLTCLPRRLPNGEHLARVQIPAEVVSEARATRTLIEQSHPALFRQPYVSACRYLYGDRPAL